MNMYAITVDNQSNYSFIQKGTKLGLKRLWDRLAGHGTSNKSDLGGQVNILSVLGGGVS